MKRRRRNKFRAIPTDGYASRLEARTAVELRAEVAATMPGHSVHDQVSIRFACGARYVCDFVVVNDWTGEIVRWVEAKGRMLPVSALKMRLLKHEFPDIHERLTIVFGKKREPRSKRKKAA